MQFNRYGLGTYESTLDMRIIGGFIWFEFCVGYGSGYKKEDMELSTGACLKLSDCPPNEYCDFSSAGQNCSCDLETGHDKCTPLGRCKNKCNQLKKEIDKRNKLWSSCNSISDCGSDFLCNTLLTAKCKKLTCDESTGRLSTTQCEGVCIPKKRRILSANFTDSGKSIVAELNFPAKHARFLCTDVFDKVTGQKLGDQCQGSVQGTELALRLHHEATVLPTDELVLKDDQDRIRDIVSEARVSSRDEEGKVAPTVLGGCIGKCNPPTTLVVYPSMISATCNASDASTGVIIDGTYSRDQSGRALACTWSFESSDCEAADLACDVFEDKMKNKTIRYYS